MKTKRILTAVSFMAIMLACTKKNNNVAADEMISQDEKQSTQKLSSDGNVTTVDLDQQAPPQPGYQQTDSIAQPPQLKPAANIDWDKKIIKTATVRLEVKDYRSFNDLVHKSVRQFGGYVAQEDNDLSEYKSQAILSIKVPVANFEDLMNGLSNTDAKLLERKINTEDVTGEVIDTKSRLEAKKQMRQKYLEFLKASKNMKEVLEVQSEINGIQEEIEAASGRIGYLSHQAAYSTINLTFFQPLTGYKPDDATPSFFTRIANAFKGGAEWIKNLFVAVISIWPLLLAILFGIILLKRTRTARPVQQP